MQMRERHRKVFDQLTSKYDGKILQYYGDGTLSIFQSAVAAVECSVEMQKAFQQEPKVPLRIGIHTGDITHSQEEVYGDGVNLASRIESSCIPGGIFISGKVYDDIKNHSWLKTKSIGEFHFKGITDGIELYAISSGKVAVPKDEMLPHLKESSAKLISVTPSPSLSGPSGKNLALKFREAMLWLLALLAIILIGGNFFFKKEKAGSDLAFTDRKVSIAVLPFSNFSGGKEDDYFSDGITEDILSLLSNIKDFRVISRTSVMQYKDTEKSIKQIARDLKVTHILEGSVRRHDNKVRVVAQLIDAINDAHLWAETYDKEITELFEVQSQIAEHIATALQRELSPTEQASIKKKPTENFQAYDYYLQGREYYSRYNKKDNDVAIQLFRNALAVDSNFALAYAGLGDALSQKANFDNAHDSVLLDSAEQVSKKAIALDSRCSEAYKSLGLAYHYKGMEDQALEAYHKAVEENPNNDMAISNIALIHQVRGDVVEGIEWAKKAKELNPNQPMSTMRLSELYDAIGLDEQNEAILKEGISMNPLKADFYVQLGKLHLRLQDYEKVEEFANKAVEMEPDKNYGYELLAHAALFQKDFETANANFKQALAIESHNMKAENRLDIELGLAYTEFKLNPDIENRQNLQKIVSSLEEKVAANPNQHYKMLLANVYAGLGDKNNALKWLEEGVDQQFLDHRMLKQNPLFEELWEDERFLKISEKVEQKVARMRRKIKAKKE